MRRLVGMVGCGLLLAVCARPEADEPASERAEAVGGEAVAHSLEVGVAPDSVRMTLHLTNLADTAATLQFTTAQRYDFEVRSPEGALVWQWSAERGFAQMLGEERLPAGETVDYEATWAPGGRTGQYVAIGRVTSTSTPIELRTEFEIPVQ